MPRVKATENQRTYFVTAWAYAAGTSILALICVADWIYTVSQGRDTYSVGYFTAILLLLIFPVAFIPSTRTVDIEAREVIDVTGKPPFRTVVRRPLEHGKSIRISNGRVGEGNSGPVYYLDLEFTDSGVTRFGTYLDERKALAEARILSAFCGIPLCEET